MVVSGKVRDFAGILLIYGLRKCHLHKTSLLYFKEGLSFTHTHVITIKEHHILHLSQELDSIHNP